jgi:diketogulonate reductase-like aldo/keto reductase
MEEIKLSNGARIPSIGLGVFQSKEGEETVNAVKWALEAGYRHIDTAMIYRNETSVGQGIRESGVDRKEIFVTTKIWNDDIRNHRVREAFLESLKRLDLDYVDMCLIHWPVKDFEDAWTVLENLYLEGKIRAIGVSNFHIHHFEELEKTLRILPMVDQIESNPKMNNQELIDYCQSNEIVVEAYSPLGGTGSKIFDDIILKQIAKAHNKSVANIIIRWCLQRGLVVLPKSVHKNYIESNLESFDFVLSPQEMTKINELNTNTRSGADPDNFNF